MNHLGTAQPVQLGLDDLMERTIVLLENILPDNVRHVKLDLLVKMVDKNLVQLVNTVM